MPTNNLWAAALSQILILDETNCPHAAGHAIRLLNQLCEFDDLDQDVRSLCERASWRIENHLNNTKKPIIQ